MGGGGGGGYHGVCNLEMFIFLSSSRCFFGAPLSEILILLNHLAGDRLSTCGCFVE